MPRLLVLAALFTAATARAQPGFPLRASDDGRRLVDANGHPFLYQADTAWKLFVGLDLPEAEEYLRARKNQGFTAVQAILTAFQGDRNRAGHLPFEGDHDFARPNEAYFAHVDAVVEKAGALGLALAVAPLWAGCCGEGWAGKSKDGRPKPMETNGPEKSRAFGRWLGQRYGKHPHLMWILGGDNDPHGSREAVRALALGLKEAAPRQLVTYHAASSHASTDVWPADERWLDVSMIYTYFRGFNKAWNKNQPDVYEEAARERKKTPARPFFLGESTYEGEHGDWGSARQARKQAYWAVLGGASGHAYGSPNWRMPENWREILRLPGAESLRHLRELFTARPWHVLVPDDDNQVAVEGRGAFASNDYATTARAADGKFVVSYLPTPRAITLDLRKVAGKRARASWFDPRTGIVTPAGVFPTRGPRAFRPPGGRTDEDWVLVVDDADAGLPLPGATLGKHAAFASVDHRGHCRKGAPAIDGETRWLLGGKGVSLVAYGSEYGHHCGQDQGRFVHVALAGDFDVVVRIDAITNGGARHFKGHGTPAKGGLMAREGNGPADRYVAIWAVSNDDPEHYPDAFHFDVRHEREAWLGSRPKGAFTYGYVNRKHGHLFTRAYPDVWVRLKRAGNTFSAFVSKDGKTWHTPSTPSVDLNLPPVLYVGVALSSAPESAFDARSTAVFRDLRGFPRVGL